MGAANGEPESLADPVAPATGRFVWPPAVDRESPERDGAAEPDESQVPVPVFGSAGDAASDDANRQPAQPMDSRPAPSSVPASTLLSFERTWLGLRSAPWAVRVAEGGDAGMEAAYCPRCGESVGAGEVVDGGVPGGQDGLSDDDDPPDPNAGCSACRGGRLPWSRAIRLGPFGGVLRDAILEAKYQRWRRLAFDLGAAIGGRILVALDEFESAAQATGAAEPGPNAEGAGPAPRGVAIVPVPMSFRRRWARGIDHTLAIARGVRSITGATIVRPLSRRHRAPQVGLPRSRREANARGSFVAVGDRPLSSFRVVIVLDDVRTTGATLRAACRAIRARERGLGRTLATTRIWVATLGVASEGRRAVPPPDQSGAGSGAGDDLPAINS
ncbi:MAG: ComF family protein [Phycisphaerales bacterium]|nr:ComF family protein [Phycisphaerales bacterium]